MNSFGIYLKLLNLFSLLNNNKFSYCEENKKKMTMTSSPEHDMPEMAVFTAGI